MLEPNQTLLEALPTPVFVLKRNPQGAPVYTLCNRAWFDTMRKTPDEVYGKTIAEILPGAPGQGVLVYHRTALTAHDPLSYEVTLPLGANLRRMTTTLTPLLDDAGASTCLLGVTSDVSKAQHAQLLEVRLSGLAKEIEALINLLNKNLLSQLERVSSLAAELCDGFVDLGDGKLQVIQQLERDAGATAVVLVDLLSRARKGRLLAQSDSFLLGDLFQDEWRTVFQSDPDCTIKDRVALVTDAETLRMVLRNLLVTAASEDESAAPYFKISAQVDSPGVISVSVSAAPGRFDFAVACCESPTCAVGPRGDAFTALLDLIRTRGGDFFAEQDARGDTVYFTLPGYLSDPDAVALSA